ncbi:hypothetical protein ACN28C_19065 [Plantactinospora sp. WMMC1484]|uniref:hypothetical protein n=1 Tax=Plantactinospora sp. WMMC1484 TaxID=3404122 RepID=UPI003BF4E85A
MPKELPPVQGDKSNKGWFQSGAVFACPGTVMLYSYLQFKHFRFNPVRFSRARGLLLAIGIYFAVRFQSGAVFACPGTISKSLLTWVLLGFQSGAVFACPGTVSGMSGGLSWANMGLGGQPVVDHDLA